MKMHTNGDNDKTDRKTDQRTDGDRRADVFGHWAEPEFGQQLVAGDDDPDGGLVEGVDDGIVAEIGVN
jgi:hypothetical protein